MTARSFLLQSLAQLAPDQATATVVESPAEADIIIFAETNHDDNDRTDAGKRITSEPLYKHHRHICTLHSGKDIPRPTLPGMYPSVKRSLSRYGFIGGPYLCNTNPYLTLDKSTKPSTVGSFMGVCKKKAVRIRLRDAANQPSWVGFDIRDTTQTYIGTLRNKDKAGHDQLKMDYAQQIHNSKFILCPAGFGLSSYRIFEAMKCGRAPVIIADHWSPPPGIRWDDFAIFVPERDIPRIPDIINAHEHEWKERGLHAYETWKTHFSHETVGNYVVTSLYSALKDYHKSRITSELASSYHNTIPRKIRLLHKRLIENKLD